MAEILDIRPKLAKHSPMSALFREVHKPVNPLRACENMNVPLPFPETLADVLDAWRRVGVAAGHSERTISSRLYTIARLARDGVDPIEASENDLIDWLSELEGADGQPLSRSSRSTYRAHLRSWFSWLAKSGRRGDDPSVDLPKPKAPRGVPHPATPAEVNAILDACSDPRAATTRAYVILAAYAGLRVHEVAKVRGEDFVGGEIRVTGKGGHSATVPMHPLIAELAESMPRKGFWFPSNSERGHVHRSSVSTAIGRAMRRAGVSAVPHSLRHYFCTQVLRASGGDLRTTQRAARHASPATTAIYTQVADETLSRAIFGIPGVAA